MHLCLWAVANLGTLTLCKQWGKRCASVWLQLQYIHIRICTFHYAIIAFFCYNWCYASSPDPSHGEGAGMRLGNLHHQETRFVRVSPFVPRWCQLDREVRKLLVKDRWVGSKNTMNASTVCAWYECIFQPSEGLLDCPCSTKGCSPCTDTLCIKRHLQYLWDFALWNTTIGN